MPDKNQGGKSFLETVQEGRRVPEDLGHGASSDFPQFFGSAQSSVVKAKDGDTIGIPTNCVSFSKVFLVWRFWGECARCSADLKEGRASLPDAGDYSCPHTQEEEYKAVVDRCLRGDAVLQARDYFNLKDGSRCVHIEWFEHDAEYLRQQQRKEEIRKKNRVWPPDPEAAFSETPIPREKRGED